MYCWHYTPDYTHFYYIFYLYIEALENILLNINKLKKNNILMNVEEEGEGELSLDS